MGRPEERVRFPLFVTVHRHGQVRPAAEPHVCPLYLFISIVVNTRGHRPSAGHSPSSCKKYNHQISRWFKPQTWKTYYFNLSSGGVLPGQRFNCPPADPALARSSVPTHTLFRSSSMPEALVYRWTLHTSGSRSGMSFPSWGWQTQPPK